MSIIWITKQFSFCQTDGHTKAENTPDWNTKWHQTSFQSGTPITAPNHLSKRNTLWGIAGHIHRTPLPHPMSRQQLYINI